MEKIRLAKYLAAAGIASRRKCEEIIFEGKIEVNGSINNVPQTLVDENDIILLDGKPITKIATKQYFILNKPTGYVCTTDRKFHTKLVLDLFKDEKKRLFTVGRLDKDTSGLLIVTNDGQFANKIIHPSFNIQKEYIAKTDLEITHNHLENISSGTTVESTFVKPLKVKKVRKTTVKIVILEGKKREVRTLLENAGLAVIELKRVRIGGLQLGSLPIGYYRPMTENERGVIFE